MALAKIYTQKKARDIVSLWVNEISQQDLEPSLIEDFIDLATIDVAEILNGATIPDYGRTSTLNDVASSFVATVIALGAGYTFADTTIAHTSHGLTAADVGKRIVFWDNTADPVVNMAIAHIKSITDTNNFVVTDANTSADITSPNCDYAVFTEHSASFLDISGLKFSHIGMIRDANNGEWIEVTNKEFQKLSDFTQKQNNIYYYRHGESIFIYEGTSASALGTITLEYFSYPTLPSAETDFLDIRDIYIPLVIAKTKNYVYEHLDKTPPEALTGIIAQKTAAIREANIKEKATADARSN